MIIYNKYILFTLKFPRPLLLTCSHMLFAIVATQLVQALAGAYTGPGQTSYLSRAIGRRPKVSAFFFMTRIVPIGVFFAMNLWLSNLALVYISISLTAMLKKSSIILVMLASFAVNLLDPSWAKVSAALVVTVGVVVATYHEVDASAQGIAFQLLAVISDVLRLVLINLLLRQEQHTLNPFHSLRLFAPCCALCLLPLLLAYEGIPPLQRVLEVGPWLLTGNLLLSFAVNICLLIVVQVTSSTVLTFAGVGKDIVLLSVSYFGFGAPIQAMQLIGYAISVVGLLVYKKTGEGSTYAAVKGSESGHVAQQIKAQPARANVV